MVSIKLGQYGSFSKVRLAKMLGTDPEQATSLRKNGWFGFWQSCGIITEGASERQERLMALWEVLHSSARSQVQPMPDREVFANLSQQRMLAFLKMRSLAMEESASHFDFKLVYLPSSFNLGELCFKINDSLILRSPITRLEREVINYLTLRDLLDKDNNITDRLTEQVLSEAFIYAAASQVEKHARGYLARRPQDEYSTLPAIRNSSNEVIGWKINRHYVALPPLLLEGGAAGVHKILTHWDERYVALTLNDESKNDFPVVPAKILQIIEENNLDSLVIQYRVNQKLLIAVNLGAKDLACLLLQRKFLPKDFKLEQIKALVEQLDFLHNLNIAHRDIKPENMFLTNGRIYLTDLDSMGRCGTFIGYAGTPQYAPLKLIKNPNKYAIKQDQYCILSSLVILSKRQILLAPDGKLNPKALVQLVNSELINSSWREKVSCFLRNPFEHELPPLGQVLNFSSKSNQLE